MTIDQIINKLTASIVRTRDSSTIRFSGSGTVAKPLKAEVINSSGSGEGVLLAATVTLTHTDLLALVYDTPFTIVEIPVTKYANIINAVIEKNFTTGYTEGSAYLVIAQANDELQAGQSIYLTNGPDGIEITSSGQKAVSEGTSPSSIQLFGGDIVFLNGAAEAMTDGHADNVLKITVYYILADKLT